MHEKSPNLGFDDSVIPNSLDHSHVSPTCSLPSSSTKYYIDSPIENPMIFDANVDLDYEVNMFNILGGNANSFVSLGCFIGFNASLDPYNMYLEDLPRKITWTTFFNPSYDLCKAIYKVEKILNVLEMILVITSCLSFFELWSQGVDNLLRASTASDLMS